MTLARDVQKGRNTLNNFSCSEQLSNPSLRHSELETEVLLLCQFVLPYFTNTGVTFSILGVFVILFCEKEAPGTATRCLLVDQVLQGQEDLSLLRRDCNQQ